MVIVVDRGTRRAVVSSTMDTVILVVICGANHCGIEY